MSSRSTVRAERSAPARARPSASVSGVRTTSHSSRMPRATASTGSNDRARSSQATMEPAAWASAASRRARVVRPLDASPRRATLAERGRPPGPRMASSAGNPVETISRPGMDAGRDAGASRPGLGASTDPSSAGSGTVANAPSVSPNRRGAAAPQRAWRVASAAVTSEVGVVIGPSIIEQMFYYGKRDSASPGRHGAGLASAATMDTMLPRQTLTDRPILVVDDDAKIVRLVRTYLEREGFAVATAGDGRAAIEAIDRLQPALVVLDLMLPEIDGRAITRAVRSGSNGALAATPILILSARGSVLDRITGLEDGADDYLPKPFSPAELVIRVKTILRRTAAGPGDDTSRPTIAQPAGRGGPAATLRHADLVVDPERHEVTRAGRPIDLTHVEFRLLTTLLEADGRVLSRNQLLDAVYGRDEAEVLDRTIDVHIGRLRDKLGDDADSPRYIATVRGVGYRAAAAQ